MKPLKSVLMIQLGCFFQAFQSSSTQTNTTSDPAAISVQAEGNGTKPQDKFISEPWVHRLAATCRWTLRMSGNRSQEMVALPPDSADDLAQQICRDLDCGGVYHVNRSGSSANASCFHHCSYQDQRLQNCSEAAGSNCSVISSVACGNQPVRLAGGSDRCAGRVEVWRDGRWGTVCDDQWDLRDADVVCAQLGCGYGLQVTGQGGSFPPGRGPVHLDELNCTGTEENLWSCPAAEDEPDCGHKEDAGVVCSEMRGVRLSGGLDRCSGKVEIHRNGSWGVLCDTSWTKDMASMVCSMLRCGAEPVKFTGFHPAFTRSNKTPSYYYSCSPSESLWQCEEFINNPFLCSTAKPSGVICNGSLGLPGPTTVGTEVVTDRTTAGSTTAAAPEGLETPSLALLIAITLSLVLLVFLIINTVICCLYRKRNAALLLKQSRTNSRPSCENPHNNNKEAVSLVKVTAKVTANPQQADVPSSARYLWTQLSSADSTSVDTDYEQYEPFTDPSSSLSTFRNSQRYRTDVHPLKPPGLSSLSEEGQEYPNKYAGSFPNQNGGFSDPQYARVSKISVDSFESSSTSSGEDYENTNGNYVNVTPEAGPDQDDFNPPIYSNPPFLYGQAENMQSSDDDLYSPVSPD